MQLNQNENFGASYLHRHRLQEQANFWGCEGFLLEFSQTCPKKLYKKVTSKIKKKLFTLFWAPLGAISAHIFRDLLRLSGIMWRFSKILSRFTRLFPDFHQTKTFRSALAPMPPTPVYRELQNDLVVCSVCMFCAAAFRLMALTSRVT